MTLSCRGRRASWEKTAYHTYLRYVRGSGISYLPGVIVNTLDGGLTARFAPQDDSIIVIGTAGQGVIDTPYQVTDRALAAQEFGFAGSLERGIEECASYSDNIQAFRIGTKPMVLKGVGLDTTAGISAPGTVTPTGSGTGGTLAAATYYYKVTALNSAGETIGSPEASVTTTGTTSSVALAWAPVDSATSYKVYRGTSAGGESVVYSMSTNSYTDTGAASTAGTVPTTNTTGPTTAGFDITFNDVTADAATRYQVWYKSGVLSVWKDGTLEYSKSLRPFGRPQRKLLVPAGQAEPSGSCRQPSMLAGFTGSLTPLQVHRFNLQPVADFRRYESRSEAMKIVLFQPNSSGTDFDMCKPEKAFSDHSTGGYVTLGRFEHRFWLDLV